MYVKAISFNAKTRTMSDDLKGYQRLAGTKGDNDVQKLHFSIDDPDGELLEHRAFAEFDVKDENSHKLRLPLDENNDIVLPNDVVRSARGRSLPVQLVFDAEDSRICSFNMLTYTISPAVRGTKRIRDA